MHEYICSSMKICPRLFVGCYDAAGARACDDSTYRLQCISLEKTERAGEQSCTAAIAR